jgi:hypothetical protein
MSTSSAFLNPYQPVSIERPVAEQHKFHSNQKVNVLVEKRWLVRDIILTGTVETHVCWDARSTLEYVRVDGVRAASKMSLLYVPNFEFQIPASGRTFHARIDVKIQWLIRVIAFQLSLDDCVVYREGVF